ncbi:hypothetical protein [Microbacterium sp. AG790]|uniref:hypothetical protein n=1 Tax=Microbacterium sp. AG790 TaxID=2183995 RepID=UPI000EB29E8E|nr:hypothetical protein [Microbacterium sp. AG790]
MLGKELRTVTSGGLDSSREGLSIPEQSCFRRAQTSKDVDGNTVANDSGDVEAGVAAKQIGRAFDGAPHEGIREAHRHQVRGSTPHEPEVRVVWVDVYEASTDRNKGVLIVRRSGL